MTIEPMQAILALGAILVAWTFWKAHKDIKIDFDMLDLLKQNGRASKVAVIVMGTWLVTTWIMINKELHGTLTFEMIGAYLTAWVAPLITLIATSNSEPIKKAEP